MNSKNKYIVLEKTIYILTRTWDYFKQWKVLYYEKNDKMEEMVIIYTTYLNLIHLNIVKLVYVMAYFMHSLKNSYILYRVLL
jgi:hypothetical protein